MAVKDAGGGISASGSAVSALLGADPFKFKFKFNKKHSATFRNIPQHSWWRECMEPRSKRRGKTFGWIPLMQDAHGLVIVE